jgi:hypothetical protein
VKEAIKVKRNFHCAVSMLTNNSINIRVGGERRIGAGEVIEFAAKFRKESFPCVNICDCVACAEAIAGTNRQFYVVFINFRWQIFFVICVENQTMPMNSRQNKSPNKWVSVDMCA